MSKRLGIYGIPNQPVVVRTIETTARITDENLFNRTADQIIGQTIQNQNRFLSDYKIDSSTSPTAATDTFTNVSNFVTRLGESTEGNVPVESSATDDNIEIVNTYLPYLESIYLPLLRFVKQSLTEAKRPDYAEFNEQKATTDESKSRVESIKTPEQRVSYFEGWFPLVRPISEPGLFALFGIGLLFLILSIGLFLRLGGVQFQLILPTFFASDAMTMDYTRFMYVGSIAGVIVGLSLYGYYEKGWFGGRRY